MTALSASASSASDTPLRLAADELHLWLGAATTASEPFVRQVLSRYAAIAPAQWRFCRNRHGKPAPLQAPRPLAFNLSDSRHWRICAVSAGAAVGVDLEYCDPQRDVLRLARRYFSVREMAALVACDESERRRRFHDYWTLKEACIKARGAALGAELEHTAFQLRLSAAAGASAGDGIGTILREPPGCNRAHYCLAEPLPDYRLATCWLPAARRRPHLRLLHLSPGGAATDLPLRVRAVSAPLAIPRHAPARESPVAAGHGV